MNFNSTPTDQPSAACQPSTISSSSRSNTLSISDDHFKVSEPGIESENNYRHASGDSKIKGSAENDNVVDVDYDKLETLERRIFKRMDADRKNRLMEIYFSRIGNKFQHSRSRKARKLAQHRRLLQDEKRQMD
ncbi:hypothetical protein CSPAE12_07020 [Colletotrichum incanum]|nr:hypothetical protein CSPAE12_07020 [Colletotrichum incanum]